MGSKKSKAKDYHNLDEALLNKLAKETLKWNPGFGKSKIKDYHRSFFFSDTKKKEFPNGLINKEQFVNAFNFDDTYAGLLFKAYDSDSTGSIDFGEFVVVKAITQEDTDQFKKAEWYLRTIYDQNGDGALSKSEIKSVLMAHYEHVSEAPLDWAQLEAKASHYTDQVFKICYGEDYAWSQFNNIYKVSIKALVKKCRQSQVLYDILWPRTHAEHDYYRELDAESLERLRQDASLINANFGAEEISELHRYFFLKFPEGLMEKSEYDRSLPSTGPFTDLLFQAYDRDKNGYIDFREYLLFNVVMSAGTEKHQQIGWLLRSYDLNGDQVLDRDEITHVLCSFYEHRNKHTHKHGQVSGSEVDAAAVANVARANTDRLFSLVYGETHSSHRSVSVDELLERCREDPVLYEILWPDLEPIGDLEVL